MSWRSEGPYQGSEFTVRLPLLRETPQRLPALGKEDQEKQWSETSVRRRILVVDDNLDSAESLALLLKIQGHEVRTAHDGLSALDVAADFQPEMVLLDIGMPGMNGYEVARLMRQMPEVQNARLVAQTGWGQEEDRRRAQEAGFDAHLTKPVDLASLQTLLAEMSGPPPN